MQANQLWNTYRLQADADQMNHDGIFIVINLETSSFICGIPRLVTGGHDNGKLLYESVLLD